MDARLAHLSTLALMGASGAASVAVIDGAVSRVGALNVRPWTRGLTRILLALLLMWLSRRAKLSDAVGDGILVGIVLVTTLDLAIAAIPAKRMEPPLPRSAGDIGMPWAPRPMVGLPSGVRVPRSW